MENIDLKIIAKQLLAQAEMSGKSYREVCDLYTQVSGDIQKLSNYFKGHKVTTWTALEDMALMEPDTSIEYQVLLQEKGWKEINNRKQFLAVRPVFGQEFIDENKK